MLMAAFTSAWPAKPQAVHRNTAWLSRESRSACPHAEHRWLVNAGSIFSTRPGAGPGCRPVARDEAAVSAFRLASADAWSSLLCLWRA